MTSPWTPSTGLFTIASPCASRPRSTLWGRTTCSMGGAQGDHMGVGGFKKLGSGRSRALRPESGPP